MRTKIKDKEYCGVRRDVIENTDICDCLNPERVRMLQQYIVDRYVIHLNKDVLHQEPPYTDNPILQKYKFTNIRREHDRTTKWLIDNISNNGESLIDRIYKTILFRIYNRIETVELLELQDPDFFVPKITLKACESWIDKCRSKINKAKPNYRFFTNAYKIGGTTVGLKTLYSKEKNKNLRPCLLIDDLIQINFAQQLFMCENQLEVFKLLSSIKGIGRFLAYQIFVDLTYIKEFPFSENEFVVVGPGCQFGIELLFNNPQEFFNNKYKLMTYEEVLFWIRNNINSIFEYFGCPYNLSELFTDLPLYDRHINIMSLENIFCEFQKYVRASRDDMSNPKNKYKPFKFENQFE